MHNLGIGDIVMAFAAIFSMALNYRFKETMASMKLEIKEENESVRQEIAALVKDLRGEFVPGQVSTVQHAALNSRLAKVEEEIDKNRDRIHETNGDFQKLIMGPLQNMQEALREDARRIADLERKN